MGTFAERTRELQEIVGDGDLEGKLTVDQRYAAVQEVGYWETGPNAGVIIRNHPRGGGSHYLSDPLFENAERYMHNLSQRVYEPGGLTGAMADNMEDLSREVHERAPRETDALRNSGHPTVTSDGETVYDRPPVIPRLSDADLKNRGRTHTREPSFGPGRKRRRRR